MPPHTTYTISLTLIAEPQPNDLPAGLHTVAAITPALLGQYCLTMEPDRQTLSAEELLEAVLAALEAAMAS